MGESSQAIAEVMGYVDSVTGCEHEGVVGVERFLCELENEKEILSLLLEEKLNQILQINFDMEKVSEKHKEDQDTVCQNLLIEKNDLKVAEERKKVVEAKLKKSEELYQKEKQNYEEIKKEEVAQSDVAVHLPKLGKDLKVLYTISRLTLDKRAREDVVKGFVVTPQTDDVNTFNFDTSQNGISSHFVTNYLWDLVSAGTSQDWASV